MAELHGVREDNIPYLTREDVMEVIDEDCEGWIRTVIYNTNKRLGFWERLRFERETGFRRVASYLGNQGRVDTYMMVVNN